METEVMTSVVETSPLWLNPLVWIVGLIVVVGLAEAAKGGFYSPKPQKANKTSYNVKYKNKPTSANSGLPKKKTSSTAKKKATRKRTPKKSGN